MGLITKDRLRDVLRGIEHLEKSSVMVGVPESNDAREGTDVTNAQIGYEMEYGVPSRNVPARPWLMPGVQKAEPGIIKSFNKAAHAALDGDTHRYEQAVTKAGQDTVSIIKYRIRSGIQPALSQRTIYERRHREHEKRFGVTPLIDTSAFINSITYTFKEPGNA